MAEELPVYDKEDLDKMSRVQLRQTAVNFGKKHREATNMESEDIKEFVLSKQEGGEGTKKSKGKSKSNGKPAAAKGRGRKAKAAPETEPEDAGSNDEVQEAPTGDLADLIHKLGLGMDDGLREIMEAVEVIQEQNLELKTELVEVQHSQFLINGLVADVLKTTWEPKDVTERVNELEEIWQSQQDGEEEGNE